MVLVRSSNFGAKSLSTNSFIYINQFTDSDSAPKFEDLTSIITSSSKSRLEVMVISRKKRKSKKGLFYILNAIRI